MSEEKKPTMKERPSDLQPRERLIAQSPRALSTVELFAILLHTGTSEKDVLSLSNDLLMAVGGLEGMLDQTVESLCRVKGVGPAKAATLLAAVELARRLLHLEKKRDQQEVCDAASAARALRANLRVSEQECFMVLLLDVKNRLIGSRELFVGTVNSTNVHPRDIFREAVRMNAVSVIVGHNHPSGDLNPSKADIALTRRLLDAGKIMGIPLLDHIIVGDFFEETYLSFKEENLLDATL